MFFQILVGCMSILIKRAPCYLPGMARGSPKNKIDVQHFILKERLDI